MSGTELANYGSARRFLAEARRVDEVKDFREGRRDGLLRTAGEEPTTAEINSARPGLFQAPTRGRVDREMARWADIVRPAME